MHQVGDRLSDAPQVVRRQAEGNPLALGLVTFGAGLLVASLLPESQKERQLARQAQPQMQKAVEGGKAVAGELAADLRQTAQESAEELKRTAGDEAQAFKGDATHEAQAARSDAEQAVREQWLCPSRPRAAVRSEPPRQSCAKALRGSHHVS